MNYLTDLMSIMSINSYTKNKDGVDNVGKIMSKWLEDLDFQKKTYTRELIGNHLLFSSKKKDGIKVLLLGHNDTVFPPNSFEDVSEDEEWIYGPGACDMKGGNIVALQALRNIYTANKEIFNIDFLLVSDEESGSDDSKVVTSEIVKNYDLCFVFEAAGENMEVVTQRKGVGTFTIHIEGKASHAGNHYDKGIDANLEASYKLQDLVKLTNLDLQTTVNVGKIIGGIGANTISPKCEITLELRYTSNDEKQRVLNSIDAIVNKSYIKGTVSTLTGSIQRDVMEENSNQLELVSTIEKITNSKLLTEKRGGVSDANIVASCGVTTLDGFGPFGDGDHTIKERALKSSFDERIDLMTKILAHFQKNNEGGSIMARKIGMWLYQNSGGDVIQQKIIDKLKERDIKTYTDINLRNAIAKNGHIIHDKMKLDKLDLFFSYNAGEQTQYQMYLYKALNRVIPMINDYIAFELTEDKFHTAFLLRKHGINTADYKLCHRDDTHHLNAIMKKWSKMVYKPTDGWGGVGLTKIENEETLNMLIPFLNQMDLRFFYVEKFIDYDNSDFRVDIVDGQFVACYGRKASGADWRTNITSGGSVFLREPNDDVINLALNATKVTGLDIAGVDIIYDRKKEEYVVLEVNGIPAFATPEQEKMGLDFNDKKIDLIVDLIDRKTKKEDK